MDMPSVAIVPGRLCPVEIVCLRSDGPAFLLLMISLRSQSEFSRSLFLSSSSTNLVSSIRHASTADSSSSRVLSRKFCPPWCLACVLSILLTGTMDETSLTRVDWSSAAGGLAADGPAVGVVTVSTDPSLITHQS